MTAKLYESEISKFLPWNKHLCSCVTCGEGKTKIYWLPEGKCMDRNIDTAQLISMSINIKFTIITVPLGICPVRMYSPISHVRPGISEANSMKKTAVYILVIIKANTVLISYTSFFTFFIWTFWCAGIVVQQCTRLICWPDSAGVRITVIYNKNKSNKLYNRNYSLLLLILSNKFWCSVSLW